MDEIDFSKSGIYIVILKNEIPINSYASDPRRSTLGTPLMKGHIKVGKAKNLLNRRKNYIKTFGNDSFDFLPVLNTLDIDEVERRIKLALKNYRIIGSRGRRLEWMYGIEQEYLIQVIKSHQNL
jgi:hypothetical protein